MRNAAITAIAFGLTLAAATAQAQDIELYDQPNFGGMRLTLNSDASDLNAFGLGRRTSSVVVRRGQWELCTQPNHGGNCISVGPGRYGDVPSALRGQIVSARQLKPGAEPPRPGWRERGPYPQPTYPPGQPGQPYPAQPPHGQTPGYPSYPGYPGQQPQGPGSGPGGRQPMPDIFLYQTADFGGAQLALHVAVNRLSDEVYNFNDTARSVVVQRGRWQLCEHADYHGECVVVGPGRHVLQGRLHGKLSSLRPVWGTDNRAMPGRGGVVLFEHSGFQGRELMIGDATPNLVEAGFNDRVSSIEVVGGRWEFCTDIDYGGQCFFLTPGRHQLDRALNDRISSLRPR